MARQALLAHVSIPTIHIHRFKGELPPAQAAQQYEKELRGFFGTLPRFDLVLLGLGVDAHTASLFPGTAAIHEERQWVIAQRVEKLQTDRLTLTPPVLNHAAHIMFLVAGSDKAAAVRSVWHEPYNPDRFPAQVIKPVDGQVIWLIDQAAAP
jgi:6-phosphogluconolactonase